MKSIKVALWGSLGLISLLWLISEQASFAALATPREGACATFVAGRGLVVYGGDGSAAGAELLATGAQLAAPLPFPADDVKGCAATALDSAHLADVSVKHRHGTMVQRGIDSENQHPVSVVIAPQP